jgi:hypothetical protein
MRHGQLGLEHEAELKHANEQHHEYGGKDRELERDRTPIVAPPQPATTQTLHHTPPRRAAARGNPGFFSGRHAPP